MQWLRRSLWGKSRWNSIIQYMRPSRRLFVYASQWCVRRYDCFFAIAERRMHRAVTTVDVRKPHCIWCIVADCGIAELRRIEFELTAVLVICCVRALASTKYLWTCQHVVGVERLIEGPLISVFIFYCCAAFLGLRSTKGDRRSAYLIAFSVLV